MASFWFNTDNGEVWDADESQDYSNHENAILKEVSDPTVDLYRLSYDADADSVVVLYPTMTNAEALVQLEIDNAASHVEPPADPAA